MRILMSRQGIRSAVQNLHIFHISSSQINDIIKPLKREVTPSSLLKSVCKECDHICAKCLNLDLGGRER